jgi:DNA (cytosine-5)-methyltransferase 1
MKTRKFRLGELFCGPGGLASAAKSATRVYPANAKMDTPYMIEHTWGVDISPEAIETFNANGCGAGICMDAWKFVNECLDKKHEIDALAFGFPCNSFSAVGEQKGFDNERFGNLYKTGVKVIETYNPKWFLAENVSGIRTVEKGAQFKTILNDLANAGKYGYDVTAHLYKFEEYGVPQARHRYLIVGIRHDLAEKLPRFEIPAPTHGPRSKTGVPFVTCREAIDKLPPQQGKSPRDNVEWRLKFTAPGENAWKLDKLLELSDEDLLKYLMALPWYEEDIAELGDVEAARKKIEEVRLKCKSARMSHIYRRLDPDMPAYTLTGSGGGGTHVYHWREHRALTNAERAALQTFPEGYDFKGTQEQIRRQIGMAVPTRGAQQIFTAILKTFAKVPYAVDKDADPIRISSSRQSNRHLF